MKILINIANALRGLGNKKYQFPNRIMAGFDAPARMVSPTYEAARGNVRGAGFVAGSMQATAPAIYNATPALVYSPAGGAGDLAGGIRPDQLLNPAAGATLDFGKGN